VQAGTLVGRTVDQEVQDLIEETGSGRRHLETADPRDVAEIVEIAARPTVIHVLVPVHQSGFANGHALRTTLNLPKLMQRSF